MTSVLMQREDSDTDMHTGRTPFKHAGKDQGDTSGSQAKEHQRRQQTTEGWDRPGTDSPSRL